MGSKYLEYFYKKGIMSKYTKEVIEPLVESSETISEVVRKLGLKISGGNISHIKKKILDNKISMNHFLGKSFMKGKIPKNKKTKKEFIETKLKEDGVGGQSHNLKLRLYDYNLKKEECEKCGLSNEWNGELISLHLDHINGINNDNRLSNLRILCPNCHSQTKTYAGKRNKIPSETRLKLQKERWDNHCVECDKLIDMKATRCKSCQITKRNAEKRDFILPTKEELYKFLKESNFLRVGKKYGVTDNAVRKWCKKYELPTNSSYYK